MVGLSVNDFQQVSALQILESSANGGLLPRQRPSSDSRLSPSLVAQNTNPQSTTGATTANVDASDLETTINGTAAGGNTASFTVRIHFVRAFELS